MTSLCVICATSPAYRCRRCESSAYCSIPCQETDYPTHKLLCKSFSSFGSSRPSANHRLAIYAAVHEKKPRMTWIEVTPDAPGWDGHDKPHLDELLALQADPRGYTGRHPTYIRGNALRGRKTNDHTIELWELDADIGPEPPVNQSLNSIDGHAWSTWRGPLVAMSKAGTDFDPASYIDVTLNDFRDVADYIYYFQKGSGSAIDGVGHDSHWGKQIMSGYAGKAQVVRIACHSDKVSRRTPEYTSVEIPRTHPAFRLADDPPSIAEALSVSLSVFKEKPVADMKGYEAMSNALENPAVRYLYCKVGSPWSTETSELGRVEDRWSRDVGTVLVLSRNREDITVDLVRALCELCHSRVISWANACRECRGNVGELHRQIKQEIGPLLPS